MITGAQGVRQTRSKTTYEVPQQQQQQSFEWGRTSQRTSHGKPRRGSVMGGTMTTAGADVDMRESYSTYLERSSAADVMTDALPDIDLYDHDNPLAVTQYVNDIYQYWYKVEPDTRVSETYMLIQGDINYKMRAILIDWLVEVHLKFKLMPETLFLTTNLIDRFLELKTVTRRNLQLVGVTAMLVASKYEEIWAPEVRDFVYISDRAYTRQQILEMEKQMLNTLGFHLTVPTPYCFLNRFFKAAGGDRQFQLYASYAVECALPEYGMLKYSGSTLAAAGVYIAIRGLQTGSWNHTMEAHTRLSESEVYPCACDMAELMRKAPTATLTAVYKKYSSEKFMKIATLPVPHDLRL
uniref:Cyclin B n=1 Tax=Ostreococcus tauri TaxID=70448 RepID=Q5SCB6_OSTTA|nr:cyclin B [Ostreococcus tauri]